MDVNKTFTEYMDLKSWLEGAGRDAPECVREAAWNRIDTLEDAVIASKPTDAVGLHALAVMLHAMLRDNVSEGKPAGLAFAALVDGLETLAAPPVLLREAA
jgi:hypothetical protein